MIQTICSISRTGREYPSVSTLLKSRCLQTGSTTAINLFSGLPAAANLFFTNRYVKQCRVLGADVVLVDTGHSYLGLCNYFKGKYITYREDRPITMNPFKITEVENN